MGYDMDDAIPYAVFTWDQQYSYDDYLAIVLEDKLKQKKRDYEQFLKLKKMFGE